MAILRSQRSQISVSMILVRALKKEVEARLQISRQKEIVKMKKKTNEIERITIERRKRQGILKRAI